MGRDSNRKQLFSSGDWHNRKTARARPLYVKWYPELRLFHDGENCNFYTVTQNSSDMKFPRLGVSEVEEMFGFVPPSLAA